MSDYKVKPGDSLWKIVKKEFKLNNNNEIQAKVYEIAKLNKISTDKINNIFVGQNLKLDTKPAQQQKSPQPTAQNFKKQIFTADSCIFTNYINNSFNNWYVHSNDKYPDLHLGTSKPEQTTVTEKNSKASVTAKKQATPSPNVSKKRKTQRLSPAQMEVTTKFTGTADDINKHLKGVLSGYGDKFLELQEKYNINAAFLAAIAMNESENGTSYKARKHNNVAGIRYRNSTKFRKYESVDMCLEDMDSMLKRIYINQGRTTIAAVGQKYCPINDPTDKEGINGFWPRNVAHNMHNILNETDRRAIAS